MRFSFVQRTISYKVILGLYKNLFSFNPDIIYKIILKEQQIKKLLIATILWLILLSLVSYAYANNETPIEVIIVGISSLFLSFIIEIIALYFIFDIFKDSYIRLLHASIVIIFFSILFNTIFIKICLDMILGFFAFRELTTEVLIIPSFVLLNAIIELFILKAIFKPTFPGRNPLPFLYIQFGINALVFLGTFLLLLSITNP